jgi:hypothetical protein
MSGIPAKRILKREPHAEKQQSIHRNKCNDTPSQDCESTMGMCEIRDGKCMATEKAWSNTELLCEAFPTWKECDVKKRASQGSGDMLLDY